KALFVDKLRDLFDQAGLVDLIWQLRDDYGVANTVAAPDLVYTSSCANLDYAAAFTVRPLNFIPPVDKASGRKIRPRNVFDQLVYRDRRILDKSDGAVQDLSQVVRRYLCRHADRDTLRTVYKQQRDASWKYLW